MKKLIIFIDSSHTRRKEFLYCIISQFWIVPCWNYNNWPIKAKICPEKCLFFKTTFRMAGWSRKKQYVYLGHAISSELYGGG